MIDLLGVRRAGTVAGRALGCMIAGAASVAAPGVASRAAAQGTTVVASGRVRDWSDATVGSEEENYLRVLQIMGIARPRPWSVRPFGPGELRDLLPASAKHPWASRVAADSGTQAGATRAATYARTTGAGVGIAVNSGFPFSMNDGAIWAGRGPTVYGRAGGTAGWAPSRWFSLSLRVEPVAFAASNLSAPIAPNGQGGALQYGDALEPLFIDNPQRFGTRPYSRVSLGQSTARVDVLGLTAGVSTADQWWGPALIDPQVLGNNAGGFPHAFVGTSRPLSWGLGTIHARVLAGRLSQTAYSPMPSDSADRTAVGGAAVITFNGAPGLELGGTRFFHEPWSGASHALSRLGAPFEAFYGSSYRPGAQNQLVSLFGRWAFAPSGLEVWGEYMRNDAAADARDLLIEPDHDAGFTVGTRKAWARADGSVAAFRVEWLDDRITHLERVRLQVRPYQHNQLRQGHTYLGQVLGSAGGQGGSSLTLGYDRYVRDGRWTFEGARRVVQASLTEGAPTSSWDVLYYARVERLRFGARRDLFLGASVMPELNRNFSGDALNLRVDAGYRF